MRERKHVKLRVDMYEDTKFKIIDTMEDRDLIHYIWVRLLALAGKVNLEGDLYMSRNIPYTVETLSIEFNRSIEKIKLALNVLKSLEMLGVTENGVYRVRNFAKHQNIKVKEKIKNADNKENINSQEDEHINNDPKKEDNTNKENDEELKKPIENVVENNIEDNKIANSAIDIGEKCIKEKCFDDKNISKRESKVIDLNNNNNQKISKDNSNEQIDEECLKEKSNNDFNSQVTLDKKKTKKNPSKRNRKKGNNDIEMIDEENLFGFSDGIDIPNGEGYRLVKCFEF